MTHSIKNKKRKQGYAILELLFYIAFFSILSFVVINSMITMARSFKETTILGELVQSGNIMERISREIRQANGINSISANDLVLNTGTNKTVEFLFSNSNAQFLEDDIFTGNLNTSNIIVAGLTFNQITTVKGKAVKVVLSVRSANDTSGRIYDFNNTVVLRGSY